MARFERQGITTHFGQKGAKDFILWSKMLSRHDAEKRRAAYLQRHKARENWNDPTSAGALSRWILWSKPTLRASILNFRRRFKTRVT